MASTASPYGFIPVKKLGGAPMSGGFIQYPIASGYAANIFTGDLVKLVAAGTVEVDTAETTTTAVGVFMGVEYTDPNTGYLVHKMYWPTGTVASDAMAYVCDDPDVLFQVQADGTVAQASVGANAGFETATAGSTTTGKSGMALDQSTIATTSTLPLRIVDIINRPGFSEAGDDYTDVLVRINTHFNRTATGI